MRRAEEHGVDIGRKTNAALVAKQEMTRGCRFYVSTVYLGGRSPRSEPWCRCFVVSDVFDGASLD
jgi:hypothetical protein